MTDPKFEELLDAYVRRFHAHTIGRGMEVAELNAARAALIAYFEERTAREMKALEYLEAWERTNPEPNWRRGDLVSILSGIPQRTGQPHD